VNVLDLNGCLTSKKIINSKKNIVCEAPVSGTSLDIMHLEGPLSHRGLRGLQRRK
jgi:hypothetical protein